MNIKISAIILGFILITGAASVTPGIKKVIIESLFLFQHRKNKEE